jgi:hypothetical protein
MGAAPACGSASKATKKQRCKRIRLQESEWIKAANATQSSKAPRGSITHLCFVATAGSMMTVRADAVVVASGSPIDVCADPDRQRKDGEKRRRADFVVDTSQGHDYARAQVHAILSKVRDIAALFGRWQHI